VAVALAVDVEDSHLEEDTVEGTEVEVGDLHHTRVSISR
jgi:hypothetical protein